MNYSPSDAVVIKNLVKVRERERETEAKREEVALSLSLKQHYYNNRNIRMLVLHCSHTWPSVRVGN